jgi:N-hydroxyarylamine O-acetyltransferase
MHINDYLDRIRYDRPVKPDVPTLRGLQTAHMWNIPFENLDIGLKRRIRIDEESIWDKLIRRQRGGFCYELNGLFAWLLKQIGFEVTYLNARVFNREGNLGIAFAHLALLVQASGRSERWLADVGFGDSFIEPLSLETRDEQVQGLRGYKLEHTLGRFIVWQRNYDGSWERQYLFDLQPHRFPEEYEAACLYHQTSPKSSFTQRSIISRATEDGRVSLEDSRLIITENGQRIESSIAYDDEYRGLLKAHFDIEL